MARKRKAKKEQKQQSKLLRRLEQLACRREDDKFLQLASQVPDLEAAGLADRYRQVFERNTRRHLRRADLERVAALVEDVPAAIATTIAALPVTRVAHAALAIDAGRLETARCHLGPLTEDLEATDGGSSSNLDLALRLSTLLSDKAVDPGPVADFHKVRRTFERYRVGELQRLPGNLRLDWAPARETFQMARAIASVKPGQWLAEKNLRRLRQCARALLAHQPLDGGVEKLASAAIQLTRAAQSDTLAMKLGDAPRRIEVDRWRELLHRERSNLAAIAADHTPTMLVGLRDEVMKRCRSMLARVYETQGPTLLARVAAGTAFDDLIERTGEAASAEAWSAIHLLLEQEDLPALARRLEETSTAEPDFIRKAQLWALELAFLDRAIDAEDEDEDEDEAGNDDPTERDDDEPPKPSRVVRQMLVRLLAISRQLEGRSDDERRSIAPFLRDRLADTFGCEHDERIPLIAECLLRTLPRDAVLLLIALSAAVEDENRAAIARWAERIRQHGSAPEAELSGLIKLMDNAIIWVPGKIEEYHRGVEPLFGAAWPQARAAAARFLGTQSMMAMTMVLFAEWEGMSDQGRSRRRIHLENVESVRSIFGGETIFHIALVSTREIFSTPTLFRKAWKKMLAEHQDLEAALEVARLLNALNAVPMAHKRIAAGLDVAIQTLVHRLDGRVSLWNDAIESLLPEMEPRQHLKPLILRLHKLLGSTTLTRTDRQRIESHLEHARMYTSARKPSTRRTKKRPRKRSARKQVTPTKSTQLGLFDWPPGEDES